MKRGTPGVLILLLIFTPVLNLPSQSLPPDLKSAVTLASSGPDQQLLETMMDYKTVQQMQLEDLYEKKDRIKADLENIKNISRKNASWGSSLIMVSALFLGSYFILHSRSDEAYDTYLDATITDDAIAYREDFQRYDVMSYTCLGFAGAGAGLSIFFFNKSPSQEELQDELLSIEKEIQYLEGELE